MAGKDANMIIMDLNQIMLSSLMMNLTHDKELELNENTIRHMILNSIRHNYVKFKREYGELIIASDSYNYWRKSFFPYYKANRKKDQEKSVINWNEVYRIINLIKLEIKEIFPYKMIQIMESEADDIISTLVRTYSNQDMLISTEPILILSGDRDFIQLHQWNNVRQYDPRQKKYIEHPNPHKYLKEHIIRGDVGDGIPNILSSDDCIINKQRQKRLQTKKVEEWINLEPNDFCDEKMMRNYIRNKTLIDLNFTPSRIQEQILEEYKNYPKTDRKKILPYFMEKRLRNLMENIDEF